MRSRSLIEMNYYTKRYCSLSRFFRIFFALITRTFTGNRLNRIVGVLGTMFSVVSLFSTVFLVIEVYK